MKIETGYRILMILLLVAALATPMCAQDNAAQNNRLSLTETTVPVQGLISSSSTGLKDVGILASEVIKGNGSRAGYMLGHRGIVDKSEVVSVGPVTKQRNRDYYIDYNTGSLVLNEPVPSTETIRVTYRYVPGSDSASTGSSVPLLSFNVGSKNTASLFFSSSAAPNNEKYDILTYGLNLQTKISDKSSMNNMLYMTSPQESGRKSLIGSKNVGGEKPKADSLFVHSSTLQSGNVSIKLNYQDVGKDFSGFTALRQQNAVPAEILNQLEKEKDIRRLGFQADINTGGKTTSSLGFNQISDSGGDILKQSLSIGNDKLKFSAGIQKIDRGFTRFNDLAEAERGQWMKEAGISRTNLQLSMAPSKGISNAQSAWNALSMSTVSDESGKLSTIGLNFTGKRLSISSSHISVDKGFRRIGDLTNDEKTLMALRIYQQFDPNATAANVRSEDINRMVNEAGLDRRNTMLNMMAGKDSKIQLGLLNIDDGSGGISRQSLSLTGKKYSITAFTQEIDSSFTRLQSLADVEKAHFANEYGMRRTNIAGNFVFNPKLQLSTSMSNVSSETGGLVKYGMKVTSPKLSIAANYMNMDTGFTRVYDLADADKNQLITEQGMRRYDLTTHFQASKSVQIDSYLYDAKGNNSELFRRQLRNSLVYSPIKGPKLSILIDQLSAGATQTTSGYTHRKYTFDDTIGKVSLSALKDTLETMNSPTSLVTVDTTALHFSTEPNKQTSIAGDLKSIKSSDGSFEETQVYRFNSKLSNRMAFTAVRSMIDTQDNDVISQEYSVSGKVSDSLNMAAKIGDTLVNGLTVGKVSEFSLRPDAPKDYGILKHAKWEVGFGQVVKDRKIETENKIFRLDTNVLKHNLALHYTSGITKEGASSEVKFVQIKPDPDPKKKLNYALSYKIRNSGASESILIRNYSADWQPTPYTKLVYNYSTNKEKPDGTIEPVGIESLKLTKAINENTGLEGQWERTYSALIGSQYEKNTIGLGLSAKLRNNAKFEVGFGYDRVITPGGGSESRTYRVKYDHQLDPDHYLVFSGTYTDWKGPKPADVTTDDVQYQIDFKTVFD